MCVVNGMIRGVRSWILGNIDENAHIRDKFDGPLGVRYYLLPMFRRPSE